MSIGKILLDTPAAHPALGFDRTAAAFAQLIIESEPRFAIGVFGDWGSGKTTLMEAIRHSLARDATVVAVEFNAWRFEREPQLLVPLLDTVRAAVVSWSATRDKDTADRVRRAALRIARVVRALASGLSAEVGVPGSVKVGFDAGKAIGLLADGEDKPQSLYVASFHELSGAFDQLRESGASRIVVFIDDLDRCLPASALDVLESMKLFFDLQGFVFVVGLDKKVVERAVRARFQDVTPEEKPPPPAAGAGQAEAAYGVRDLTWRSSERELDRLERDYVEKIFQVPYHVPPMLADDLDTLLLSMYGEAGLGPQQLADFQNRVKPYLDFVAVERRVNPREVKRFLNAYTVQTAVRPELDPDAVLALQTLTFRYDWQPMYDAILTDSILFVDALKRYRAGDDSAFEDLSPDLSVIPADLADYLRSKRVDALCVQPSLDVYLSSLHSTQGIVTALVDAYQELGRLRAWLRKVRAMPGPTQAEALELVSLTAEVTSKLISPSLGTVSGPPGLSLLLQQMQDLARDLNARLQDVDEPIDTLGGPIRDAAALMYELANRVYRELRSLQRGYAAAG